MTGQQLLDRWIAFLRRYVALTDSQALVVALWAITTWVSERYAVSPYLEICATAKRSGKTTLLDVLALVTRNVLQLATVRVLTIVRYIAATERRCTVLIDEAEQLSRANLGDTRSALATGYRAGANHAINVGAKLIQFPTSCPKAFALIGNVHPILRDRCIEIELLRDQPERILAEWRDVAEGEAQDLIAALRQVGNRVARWPVVPADWLRGRERELWTPLVSVAHALGLHADTMRALEAASVDIGMGKLAPAKTWHAAQDEEAMDEREMAERALTDLATVLPEADPFLPSASAVDRLRAVPTAPWRAWHGGLNEVQLASLLARYGVEPRVGQTGRGKARKTARGYRRQDVIAAVRAQKKGGV